MRTLYCAIGYVCNEKCVFCPCSEGAVSMPSLDFEEICQSIDEAIAERQIENVLLSGGEPTIHKDFFQVLEYIVSKKLKVSLLTNAIKLADMNFVDRLLAIVDVRKLDITIAFHSHLPEKHDALTQHPGSFELSLAGAHNLLACGVSLSVKNNIVNHTFRDLPGYVDWVNTAFPDNVTLLFCNIDVNGVALKNKEMVAVSFEESMPYLTRALDKIINLRRKGHKRNTKVLTTPLCLIDPYYWGFVENQTQYNISSYKVPSVEARDTLLLFDVSSDSGPMFAPCRECAVRTHCPGAWRSFKQMYGEERLKRIYAE